MAQSHYAQSLEILNLSFMAFFVNCFMQIERIRCCEISNWVHPASGSRRIDENIQNALTIQIFFLRFISYILLSINFR